MFLYDVSPSRLRLELLTATDRDLFDRYVLMFQVLGCHAPKNELEETQILELSKVFIAEFKRRLLSYHHKKKYTPIIDLANSLQPLLKSNKLDIDKLTFTPYLINTSVRLYCLCIKYLRHGKVVDPRFIKKEFL